MSEDYIKTLGGIKDNMKCKNIKKNFIYKIWTWKVFSLKIHLIILLFYKIQ
jgi:hypothetical protein